MVEIVPIGSSKLDDAVEDTFRTARQDALESGATAVIIVVIRDSENTISYNTHNQGVRNSQALGYLELAKQQVYSRMGAG